MPLHDDRMQQRRDADNSFQSEHDGRNVPFQELRTRRLNRMNVLQQAEPSRLRYIRAALRQRLTADGRM